MLYGGNPRMKEIVSDFPNAFMSHILKAFATLMSTNSDADLIVTLAKLDIALDCKPARRSADDSHEYDNFFLRATIHRDRACDEECKGTC